MYSHSYSASAPSKPSRLISSQFLRQIYFTIVFSKMNSNLNKIYKFNNNRKQMGKYHFASAFRSLKTVQRPIS